MTELTPKPELRPYLVLAGGTLLVLIVCGGLLLYGLPAPHTPLDYLIVGTLGTFLALLTIFVFLTMRRSDRDR